MNDDNRDRLEQQMSDVFEAMALSTPGTEEYTALAKQADMLCKISIDRQIAEDDLYNKACERGLKDAQVEKDRKQNFWLGVGKIVAETVGVLGGFIFYGYWCGRGMKFEETGVFSSSTVKGLFQGLRPKK